jgi:predicted MPP superfamily phosphohydrolase
MLEARGEHEVVDVEVPLAKLPRALDGFTIVQLSDLHTGMTIDRSFVQRVVDRANALSPDLIALTGDLVDGKVEDLRDDVAPLAALRARHGIYAVTGNHEYYAGADPWIAEITRLGARFLRNELVTIGAGDASFDLAGVDDHSADGYPGHGEDLEAATAGRDPARALVLLAHQPRQVRRAAKFGVDLQLSGHTHGGQIWPWHYIVRIQQGGLLAGRYQHGDTTLYVTRGCGYWGPPVRLGAPLEITRVILRSGSA